MKIRALLVLLCLWVTACERSDVLYSNLTEREANEMLAVLMDAGIIAKKQNGADGISLLVEGSNFVRAISLLEERGLPSERFVSLGDVFAREGIVSSPMEERARYIYALSQELSRMIGETDGIISARVLVNLPETNLLGKGANPSSASVTINHRADAPIAAAIPKYKLLVANAIEGLVYDNVTVQAFPVSARAERAISEMQLRQFAGVAVHPSSLGRLQMIIGGLGILAALGIGFGIMTALRASSKRRTAAAEASELL